MIIMIALLGRVFALTHLWRYQLAPGDPKGHRFTGIAYVKCFEHRGKCFDGTEGIRGGSTNLILGSGVGTDTEHMKLPYDKSDHWVCLAQYCLHF